MTRMTAAERQALCDTALQVGADHPTLSGDWTVQDLLVHLLVRERSLAAVGIPVAALSGLTVRASARVARAPFEQLVERFRQGPPRWSPYALPKVGDLLNTAELFIHHEDIRRSQEGWEPRPLPAAHQAQLWSTVRAAGRTLTRRAPVGVLAEAAGAAGATGAAGGAAVLRDGVDPVTVRGLPGEILLFLFGRQQQAQVQLAGSDTGVAALRQASLGL